MNSFTGIFRQHFQSTMLCPYIDLSPPPPINFSRALPHVPSTSGKPCYHFLFNLHDCTTWKSLSENFKNRSRNATEMNWYYYKYYCYYSIINSAILYFSVSFTNDQNARPFKQKMVPTLLFVTERTLLLWLKNFMSLPKRFVWPPFSHSRSSFYEWWSKNNMCSHVENTIWGSLSEAPSSFYFLGIQTCSNIPFTVRF